MNDATSAASLAMSSAAMAEASKAKKLACLSYMKGYTHDGASVQQIQEYAKCGQELYKTHAEMPDYWNWIFLAVLLVPPVYAKVRHGTEEALVTLAMSVCALMALAVAVIVYYRV